MKSLWIQQPDASYLAEGETFFINKGWGTNYRGEATIYAGKLRTDVSPVGHFHREYYYHIAVGYLVNSVDMRIHEIARKIHGDELVNRILENKHYRGPYCWIFEDVEKIKPVKATASFGIGTVSKKRVRRL